MSMLHPLFLKANALTGVIIGAAIEVHRLKGPGLLESIYERCLMSELDLRQKAAISQRTVEIEYKGMVFEETLRFDMMVESCVLIELKSVIKVQPIHKAQLMSYMKLLNIPLGLLINFSELKLVDGIHRMMIPGADGKPYTTTPNTGD